MTNAFETLLALLQLWFFTASIYILACWAALRRTPRLLRFERAWFRFARRRRRAVVIVFAAALLARIVALPLAPMKPPVIHDEFSYLLAGDTFASGRVTNPPHPLWHSFETFHVLQQPTYMSIYPPAQGLALALGKVLTGSFAFGVWLSVAAMCAALCWALQGWLPPQWALLGGVIAILRIAVSDYWSQSYWGGAVAAFGGALLVGAWARIVRRPRWWDAVLGAIGVVILANSRPYEGGVLALVVAVSLLLWFARLAATEKLRALRLTVAPMLVVIAVGAALTLYYNRRVTGNALLLPHLLYQRTYGMPPLLLFQRPPAPVAYRVPEMERFFRGWVETNYLAARDHLLHTWLQVWSLKLWPFYVGFSLALPFLWLRWTIGDRRVRWLLVAALAALVVVCTEVLPLVHYLAPFLAVFYGLLLQGLRHLRYGARHNPWRLTLTWSVLLACVLGMWVALVMQNVHVAVDGEGVTFYGNETFAADRQRLEEQLESTAGNHLVMVRYGPEHVLHKEWVYNRADIDGAKVVWARELGGEDDARLLAYFHNRRLWLLEADASPPALHEVTNR